MSQIHHYLRKNRCAHGVMYGIGGSSEQSNATTSQNSSDTTTSNVSTNTTTNTSYNTTDNNTSTLTQDRRSVNDHGLTVSADASKVITSNSGNSSSVTNDIVNNTTSDFGAISGGIQLGLGALKSNSELAAQTLDASKFLMTSGRDLVRANFDFLEHVSDGARSDARSAIAEVVAASGNALNQVTSIAAKPLNANDPQRLVIIVALGVIGIVFLSKMKG